MDKFFGGAPIWVILRLVVISLVLGVVLSAFQLDAFGLVRKIRDLISYIYSLGFDAFAWMLDYFILGAVIVFPIWLIIRLFSVAKDRDPSLGCLPKAFFQVSFLLISSRTSSGGRPRRADLPVTTMGRSISMGFAIIILISSLSLSVFSARFISL